MPASKRPRIHTLRPRLATLDTRCARPPAKEADRELLTEEHRVWRAAVLRRAGNRCEDCGRTGTRLFADHVSERQDGGARLDPANVRLRCPTCHGRKTVAARDERMRRSWTRT